MVARIPLRCGSDPTAQTEVCGSMDVVAACATQPRCLSGLPIVPVHVHCLIVSVTGARQRASEVGESSCSSESQVVGYTRLDRTKEQFRKMGVRLDSNLFNNYISDSVVRSCNRLFLVKKLDFRSN